MLFFFTHDVSGCSVVIMFCCCFWFS